METINNGTLTFKKSDFKITWKHYLLAIPPVAQFFLFWYLWQLTKILGTVIYKNIVKAFYTQTAILLHGENGDASSVNKIVDIYHNKQMKESIIKAKRFEKIALLSVVLIGACWFTLPPSSTFNCYTVGFVDATISIPEIINRVLFRR